jgi:aminotransferase
MKMDSHSQSLKPERFVADHVRSLPRSGIRDFFGLVAKMPEAISLGIGEPDFITPWRIREAAIFALERGKTSYTDNLGLIQLRRAISQYVDNEFSLSYHPENEILTTVGVSEALDLALRAIVNPGDKILYHQPCYVSYQPSITLAHGKAIGVQASAANGFTIDTEALESAWEPGCKALILNFPTNPTGAVADLECLRNIAHFAISKDLLVVSDEIYAELTYEGDHASLAGLPGMRDRTIFLHGVSKAFAMTGFRIGYACAPAAIIEAMMKVHQYGIMCAPIVSQEAAIEALRHGRSSVVEMMAQYRRRRDYLARRFSEIGLPCVVPEGTFYAFPDIRPSGLDEVSFCHRLLEEEKVAMVPGTAFGPGGEGHVRASFSTSFENLIEAASRIDRFMDRLNDG